MLVLKRVKRVICTVDRVYLSWTCSKEYWLAMEALTLLASLENSTVQINLTLVKTQGI